MVLLLQYVALYLPKQSPILSRKVGVWAVASYISYICDGEEAEVGGEAAQEFSPGPHRSRSNYLLPTFTSAAVSSHFASNLQSC